MPETMHTPSSRLTRALKHACGTISWATGSFDNTRISAQPPRNTLDYSNICFFPFYRHHENLYLQFLTHSKTVWDRTSLQCTQFRLRSQCLDEKSILWISFLFLFISSTGFFFVYFPLFGRTAYALNLAKTLFSSRRSNGNDKNNENQ